MPSAKPLKLVKIVAMKVIFIMTLRIIFAGFTKTLENLRQ